MRKLFAIFLALVMMSVAVAAAGQVGSGSGTGAVDTEDKGSGEGSGEMKGDAVMAQTNVMAQVRSMAQNSGELKSMIQERQRNMEQQMEGMGNAEKEVYMNQNKVRLAVHSFLAMEELAGNRGQQISAIAKEFNNSVQATIRAEEKVQTRSGFARFFAGGDAEAGEEIGKIVEQNQARIQQLKQLRTDCDCGEDVNAIMQEQIQNMEQEQSRLGELAQKEKGSKGLFGWIWK